MGVGMILHDNSGGFLSCRSLVFPGLYHSDVGEAMSLLEALSWIKQLGLQRVKIEVDTKLVVEALKTSSEVVSMFNYFIHACKRELVHLLWVSIDFVYRAANEKVHRIAIMARTFSSHNCWVEPPSFMVGLLNGTCIC
ncbi:hypothetical protein ACS0TY_006395 [Phlomoides rotata]